MCPQKDEKEFDSLITSLEKRIKGFSKNVKDDKDATEEEIPVPRVIGIIGILLIALGISIFSVLKNKKK